MNYLLEYLIVFILVFIFTYFISIRKKQKYNKNEIPLELSYLELLYNINIKKINYKKFIWLYSIINTFIIATTYIIIVSLLDNLILQIIIGIIILILLIVICYGLLGRYYQKKEGKKHV